MAFDKLSWQLDGGLPEDVDELAGRTHMAHALAWVFLRDLASGEFTEEDFARVPELERRAVTPGTFFDAVAAEGFYEDQVAEEAQPFFAAHYDDYVTAYTVWTEGIGLPTPYHAPDTWATYEVAATILDDLYAGEQRGQAPSSTRDDG